MEPTRARVDGDFADVKAALNTPKIRVISRTVKAGKREQIEAVGACFYLKECSQPALIQMDDADELPWDVGTGLDATGTGAFKRLTVINIWSEDMVLVIYVSTSRIIDNRFTLVPSRDFALPVYEAKTELLGSDLDSIAANSEITFTGLLPLAHPLFKKRKSFIVSNLDPANPLYVYDGAGKLANAVHAGTSMEFAVSGPMMVKNNTAAVISACFSEIWISR